MTDLAEKRTGLHKLYEKWRPQIDKSFLNDKYSYPYFLSVPDDWCEKKLRIMIVGEEGAGIKEPFDASIEQAQEFNREFMNSQLETGKAYSRFWSRIINIHKQHPEAALCWTNLDKIHISQKGNGALPSDDIRKLLHQTEIKILREEIGVLEPTHIIFFGWYNVSLEAELPEVHKILYSDTDAWKDGRPLWFECSGKYYVFSYHPGWGYRKKGYEETVLQELEKAVEAAAKSCESSKEKANE